MSDFFKKNKIIIVILAFIVILFTFVAIINHSDKPDGLLSKNSSNNMVVDNATGDSTAESLNALTEQLHEVIKSNQTLQNTNSELSKKNSKILSHIKEEVQNNLSAELKKRGDNNTDKIKNLENKLNEVNHALNHQSPYDNNDENNESNVQNNTDSLSGATVKMVNGERLVSIPDLDDAAGASKGDSQKKDIPIENNPALKHIRSKHLPFYTIPNGATLANSISMTALIGRVPINGVVKSPYPFKMIIGNNNMAANSLHIPGISGAIVQGYTVGDMSLSCVKGYITAITFVFPDGTISTTSSDNSADSSDGGFTDSLGYISEPNGNPCFTGKFYTNAPKYLSTIIALGALNKGGEAYALGQQTASNNALGGTTTALTGSVAKYMAGGAVQGGTQQAMDWFTEREKNSFDAVYVPAGRKAVLNITKEIDINYNPKGRKLYYENKRTVLSNTSLD
jgi:hypothetical protein